MVQKNPCFLTVALLMRYVHGPAYEREVRKNVRAHHAFPANLQYVVLVTVWVELDWVCPIDSPVASVDDELVLVLSNWKCLFEDPLVTAFFAKQMLEFAFHTAL